MQTDRSKKYWTYMVGGALVVLAAWLFYFRPASGDRPVQLPVAAVASPDAAAKHADESAPVISAAPPSPHASSYEHAGNLLAIVQAAEGKTDRVSLELRARALHECRTLGATPNEFDNLDMKGPALYGDKLPTVKTFAATYL
ncbi:MAG: hypothetical protein ABIR10_01425, partial [Dokdonella sp.]